MEILTAISKDQALTILEDKGFSPVIVVFPRQEATEGGCCMACMPQYGYKLWNLKYPNRQDLKRFKGVLIGEDETLTPEQMRERLIKNLEDQNS